MKINSHLELTAFSVALSPVKLSERNYVFQWSVMLRKPHCLVCVFSLIDIDGNRKIAYWAILMKFATDGTVYIIVN